MFEKSSVDKPERKNHWGCKLLANLKASSKVKKASPGQKYLWYDWKPPDEIQAVAEKFVLANCFDPKVAGIQFDTGDGKTTEKKSDRCQVTDRQNPDSS